VDNASNVDCRSLVRELSPETIFVQNNVNVGFGRANNQALKLASGRFVLLLNTDAFVSEDAIPETLAYMKTHIDVGILGVRLVGGEGNLQPCCRYFPTPLNAFLRRTGLKNVWPWSCPVDDMNWDHASIRECDWVPGCYFLVRRETINEVGLFDPRYFLYCEEVDHCREAKKRRWKVVFYPFVEVVHLGGESAKTLGELNPSTQQLSDLQLESELLYFRKHYSLAGVIAHLGLFSLANFASALHAILLPKLGRSTGVAINNIRLAWKIFFLTKFASVSTR
jgi:N-acetylglucosaminyl-diphospho-decaprenol L-rhamnosyltransferase